LGVSVSGDAMRGGMERPRGEGRERNVPSGLRATRCRRT
jgi:hypothetical protein